MQYTKWVFEIKRDDLPGEFIHLGDEIVLDDVERVLRGQKFVVLRNQVLNLLAHAFNEKENVEIKF